MKELSLKIGQKCWSIQLGDCEVVKIVHGVIYPFVLMNSKCESTGYALDGKCHTTDAGPSLFLSNPFENHSVNTNEMVKDKLETIKVMVSVLNSNALQSATKIAQKKLEQLLESI